MTRTQRIAEALARGISGGPLTPVAAGEIFKRVLGKEYRFVEELITRLIDAFDGQFRIRQHRIRRFLLSDPDFTKACHKHAFSRLSLVATSDDEPDVLKAILHNCSIHGPVSQNRTEHPEFQAHLAGRIAQMNYVNPGRGEKLMRLYEQIDWT